MQDPPRISSQVTARPMKRARPPNLTLGVEGLARPPVKTIAIETAESPVDVGERIPKLKNGLQVLSPSSTSSSPLGDAFSVGSDSDLDGNSDDLSKNLEILEKLRRNVHQNLRLRPLRSSTAPPESPISPSQFQSAVNSPSVHWRRSPSPISVDDNSPSPSPALSVYYTPTTEFHNSPLSARFLGHSYARNTVDSAMSVNSRNIHSPAPSSAVRVEFGNGASRSSTALGVEVGTLFKRLASKRRPLLIDTRPPASYLSSRIEHSLNIAVPSLIMRRCTKPGGGFASLHALRTYITTERGKEYWDELLRSGTGDKPFTWDGDVIVYDEDMDEKKRDNAQCLSWAMLSVLQPLLEKGSVEYLKGGISAARLHAMSDHYIVSGEREISNSPRSRSLSESRVDDASPRKGGLFQLDTLTATRSKAMPEIEPPTTSPGPIPQLSSTNMLCDLSPSPSPSIAAFPHQSKQRKGSVPNLRRIDTSSAERLIPKLTLRTVPSKSNTLAAPTISRQSSSSSLRAKSPSHLNLNFSNSNGSSTGVYLRSGNSSTECLSPLVPNGRTASPRSPLTPIGFPSSPVTARPDYEQPPSTEDPLPVFTVSTILPNFLFLGPELSSPDHVEELLSLGVKRILNIAIECDDDQGLHLRQKFERYTRIPMRDTVEEENVARSVREACEALGQFRDLFVFLDPIEVHVLIAYSLNLDDARLHSAPTYVHCKAGKSRSVTAVIAYLIHANHWTLSRAYQFVTERRKGISPNIGFVSELMTFEEQELGGKSVGVVNSSASMSAADADDHSGGKQSFGYAVGARRGTNMRESLPPILATQKSEMIIPGQLSAGGFSTTAASRVGDSAQEKEIKDETGRYRHARRAPVDENTLQPMRRVSKAGLESSWSHLDI